MLYDAIIETASKVEAEKKSNELSSCCISNSSFLFLALQPSTDTTEYNDMNNQDENERKKRNIIV